MALLLQHDLLVAGDALAEVVAGLVASVERCDHNRVDTSQSGAHGLGLGAQQVNIAVVHRVVEQCGLGIDHHLAGAVALGTILLDNLSPELTASAELGYLHEVDGGDAHVELDAGGHLLCAESSVGELCHPLIAPCQGIAELLIDVSTGIVENN